MLVLYSVSITILLSVLIIVFRKRSRRDWQHFNAVLDRYRQTTNVKSYKFSCDCGIFAIMPKNVAEHVGWRCIQECWKCPECNGLLKQYSKLFSNLEDAPTQFYE